MTTRSVVLLLLAASALAGTLFAQGAIQVLVLRDGRQIRCRSWQQKDALVHIVDERGQAVVVKTELVDFEKSRRATELVRRPPTPTPTPREKSLVEVAEEIQRRRSRGERPQPLEPITNVKVPTPVVPAVPEGEAPAGATGEATAAGPAEGASPAPPDATPAATPEAALAAAATPASTPAPAAGSAGPASAVPPLPPSGPNPLVLYGGIGVALAALAGGALFLLRRRAPAAAPAPGVAAAVAPAAAAPADDELLTPAFADEAPAADLPAASEVGDDSFAAPAEIGGSTTTTKALPEAPPEVASPGILIDGEIQIRINQDVYTCPNLASLKRWVEEGRVIETSEILSPEGTWLMAGTIPDLEQSFERRRETLGY